MLSAAHLLPCLIYCGHTLPASFEALESVPSQHLPLLIVFLYGDSVCACSIIFLQLGLVIAACESICQHTPWTFSVQCLSWIRQLHLLPLPHGRFKPTLTTQS